MTRMHPRSILGPVSFPEQLWKYPRGYELILSFRWASYLDLSAPRAPRAPRRCDLEQSLRFGSEMQWQLHTKRQRLTGFAEKKREKRTQNSAARLIRGRGRSRSPETPNADATRLGLGGLASPRHVPMLLDEARNFVYLVVAWLSEKFRACEFLFWVRARRARFYYAHRLPCASRRACTSNAIGCASATRCFSRCSYFSNIYIYIYIHVCVCVCVYVYIYFSVVYETPMPSILADRCANNIRGLRAASSE